MQLQQAKKDTKNFLLSTYFADGLRITMGVLLPSLILAQFGLLKIGITLSLGALCVSIVDSPGPIVHRRNAMLITSVLIFICSFITGVSNQNNLLLGLVILIASFAFSMLYCYGVRAASIGTATLLIVILSIDDTRPLVEEMKYSVFILMGGIWYTCLSYLVYRVRPYRGVQQALSDSILEVASYLTKKASLFSTETNFDATFSELVKLQVKVHEKQNEVRDLLFRTRSVVRDSSVEGRFLLIIFIDMVDIFERAMATHYDYRVLHEKFGKSDVFADYERFIKHLAATLNNVAFAIKDGNPPKLSRHLLTDFEATKLRINQTLADNGTDSDDRFALKSLGKIEENIERIFYRVETMIEYFNMRTNNALKRPDVEPQKFIDREQFGLAVFTQNLTLKSNTFKHALRVTTVMVIGFCVSLILPSNHSYWILLTILVISKPGFSLTKQRNYQRVIGTIVGAIIGMILITYVTDTHSLFVILLMCMVGCYSFQRKNYVISVVFMTPYILLLYKFLGLGTITLAGERIYDTLIGSGIAFAASYFLFPSWEKDYVKEAMVKMLEANRNYFTELIKTKANDDLGKTLYKLARKEVYVASANLSSMFQRMFSEPKSKQIYMSQLYEFTVMNHLFSSYVASLSLIDKREILEEGLADLICAEKEVTKYLDLSVSELAHSSIQVEQVDDEGFSESELRQVRKNQSLSQCENLQKAAYDIFKISKQFKFEH
ncbi:putative membrane protein (TIGR01666 family) [Pedobacter sp. UYP30]|uniref:FUSC family membrane protein n=1 Tax=Pedobacter sp. UYP30 TaxID=1756400 RepID=UPI0033997FBE